MTTMTIEYKLAKQLQKAGFPEPKDPNAVGVFLAEDIDEEGTYAPTLSELIEACGEGFDRMLRKDTGRFYAYKAGFFTMGEGDTPEEAVAKLWLQLEKEKIKEEKLYQELKNDRGDDSAKEFLPPEEKR